jgi:uncharacterized protein with beta-barrel porin domain
MRTIYAGVRLSIAVIGIQATQSVHADNADFQNFFFDACTNPTGTLATRCAETPGGTGDLSGNSESSLNPSQTLSSNFTPLENARYKMARASERIDELTGDSETPTSASQNRLDIGPFSLLLNGGRTWIDRDRDINDAERGYDGDVWSAELGLDYRVSDQAVIGGFLGYENTDYDYDKDESGVNFTPQNNSGKDEADSYSLTLFGAYDLNEGLSLDGSVGYSITDYTFQRNVVFQESTRTTPQTNVRTEGKPDGNEYWFSLGTSYDFYREELTYTPYVRATYIKSDIDSYVEKDKNGSGLNMKVDSDDRKSVTATAGVKASYAVSMDWGVLVPQVRAEYEHQFDQDAQKSRSSYVLDADKNKYSLKGDDPDRNYFNLGAGIVAVMPNGWSAFVDYTGLVGYDDLKRHQLTAGVRMEF